MRARKIHSFTRGGDPYRKLGIGRRALIEKWFDTYAPDAKYKINDDEIIVVEDLDLQDTGMTSLPDGLSVGRDLDLRGSDVTRLPDDLSVGGSLYLQRTNITTLPDGLSVGGEIYKDF